MLLFIIKVLRISLKIIRDRTMLLFVEEARANLYHVVS